MGEKSLHKDSFLKFSDSYSSLSQRLENFYGQTESGKSEKVIFRGCGEKTLGHYYVIWQVTEINSEEFLV